MADQKTARIRKMFPGGNTAYGFYSFYDQIIAPDARRLIIIKGGPGVGKSSFMRHIAGEMARRGFAVEQMHCSADNDSLDGVVFPEIGVAMIDGTAPHVVDPKNPGCVDEIIHLGDFWDEEGMVKGKDEIIALNREVGRLFARAYRFLRAAKEIRDAWSAANAEGLHAGQANQRAAEIIARLCGQRPVASQPGRIRRLFASALTPDGPRHYLSSIFGEAKDLIVVKGAPGTGKSTLLGKAALAAVERGLAVECYHCAFDPERLEHIYLPELEAGLVTVNAYHDYGAERAAGVLDMNECRSAETAAKYAARNEDDRELYDALIGRAFACLRKAKETHDLMEDYYVPNMDFAAIDEARDETLARILKYAGILPASVAM
ncbi:MAG: PRK06851 family protein [Bacteroidota bacterium]